jgi:transcriptional regulator with XRE-family HTH domain
LQQEVGRIIGADESTVYNWEKGYTVPALWFYPKIIDFLGYIPFEVKPKTLGERLIFYRKVQGISRKKLAKQLGVDPATLARWENEKGQPLKRLLEDIEIFFNKNTFISSTASWTQE